MKSPRQPPVCRAPPPIPEKVTYNSFEDLISKFDTCPTSNWKIQLKTTEVMVVKKFFEEWPIYATIQKDLNFVISVDSHKLPINHFIYKQNSNLKNIKLSSLLTVIDKLNVCPGNNSLLSLPLNFYIHHSSIISVSGEILSTSTYRNKNCLGLLNGACNFCNEVGVVDTNLKVVKPKTPLSSCSKEQLIASLKDTRKNVNKLKDRVKKLMGEINRVGESIDETLSNSFEKIIENDGTEFHKIFFHEQKKRWKGQNGKWHPMLIRYAILLHSRSPSAYELLRDTGVLKLPSSRTLCDYSQYIAPGCGLQKAKLDELRQSTENLIGHQRFIGIVLDEMKIFEGLVYRSNNLIGWVDLGSTSDNMTQNKKLATHVLALHVVGISTHVKFPLAYYAVTNLKAGGLFTIVWKALGALENLCNLDVIFITSDGASVNRSFIKMHAGKLPFKTANPCSESDDIRYIYFIVDPPHLIKTLRNNLYNSGSNTNTKFLKKDAKYLLWKHVKDLCSEDIKNEIKRLPKITQNHIFLTPYSKMRVNLAAQVMSASVGNLMLTDSPTDCSETAQYILQCNNFFDCMNVRSRKEGGLKRNDNLLPYVLPNDPRLEIILKDFLGYFEKWKSSISAESKSVQKKMFISEQTHEGLIITCNSVVELVKYALNKGMPFMLTAKLNQDVLEQHFGRHRSAGRRSDNPTMSAYMTQDNNFRVIRAAQYSLMPKGNITSTKTKIPIEMDDSPMKKRKKTNKSVSVLQ